ncbi:MAG: response regulator [Gammaproteobacteria bacterium]|nr:response regulator [Gammaproteobacteria bacterium]
MKILIVDDNIDLANGLQEILQIDNHHVSIFHNAEDALLACQNQIFDIAFIDVKLPGMNGVELFSIIKNTMPETYLFIISGYRITQIIEESTGIEHTPILNEQTNQNEIIEHINNIDSIPLTLAIAETDDYISRLANQFHEMNKKPLIIDEQQLVNYNLADYDVIILNTKETLIYALTNFMQLRNQGYNIPTILISEKSIGDHSKNALHTLELTGCIFKPFQLEQILGIVESIQINKEIHTNNTISTNQQINISFT